MGRLWEWIKGSHSSSRALKADLEQLSAVIADLSEGTHTVEMWYRPEYEIAIHRDAEMPEGAIPLDNLMDQLHRYREALERIALKSLVAEADLVLIARWMRQQARDALE